ncbi:MAG: prepilin-type N-terminal cleavage/methylation domain-containing protein [Candidatus Omnitrophota bacterium]
MRNTSELGYGFTILELVIVIIIIGILAGLALPRLMNMVKMTYSAEALSGIATMRREIERCYLMKQDYIACWFEDPVLADGARDFLPQNGHFQYDWSARRDGYEIMAGFEDNESGIILMQKGDKIIKCAVGAFRPIAEYDCRSSEWRDLTFY